MVEEFEVKRLGEHGNAFGFLRLLFASLVIVSHTPELADGDRRREILTHLFGTITFGELAVDGFFLVSGYLIVGSYIKKPDVLAYLLKRVARIYPAFIAASALSLLVVAPLAGVKFSDVFPSFRETINHLEAMLLLRPPVAEGAFLGSHYAQLDGPMWTIAFEFRCYLLVLVLGALGVLRRPWLVASIGAMLLCAFELQRALSTLDNGNPLFSHGVQPLPFAATMRLTGIFLIGAFFFLRRDCIRFTPPGFVMAIIGMLGCLGMPYLAEPGVASFGAYLIFATAAWGKSGIISRINNRNDISYGVYLYAFPAEKLLLWFWPALSLACTGLLTFAIACLCGWLSWHGLEKPIMRRLNGNAGSHPSSNSNTADAIGTASL